MIFAPLLRLGKVNTASGVHYTIQIVRNIQNIHNSKKLDLPKDILNMMIDESKESQHSTRGIGIVRIGDSNSD